MKNTSIDHGKCHSYEQPYIQTIGSIIELTEGNTTNGKKDIAQCGNITGAVSNGDKNARCSA